MASRISRIGCSHGLPPGLGLGTHGSILCHSVSVRSLGYGFLLGCSAMGVISFWVIQP